MKDMRTGKPLLELNETDKVVFAEDGSWSFDFDGAKKEEER